MRLSVSKSTRIADSDEGAVDEKLTRKAPRARERPATWVSTEVPRTTSRVVAANTSGLPMSAIRR